jgi:DNA-binding NtrC family response regulator
MVRLLLVENEAISRAALSQFLANEGYSVIPLASGKEALKILENEKFEVVITDYRHGDGVTGIDVLRRFEELTPGRGKILMSAYAPHQIGEMGDAVFVPKPVDFEHLLAKLQNLLK